MHSLLGPSFHSRYHALSCVISFSWLALVVLLDAWDLLIFLFILDGDFTTSFLTNPVEVVLLLHLLSSHTELLFLLAPGFALCASLFLNNNWRAHPLEFPILILHRTYKVIVTWLIILSKRYWHPWVRWHSFHLSWSLFAVRYLHASLSFLPRLGPLLSFPLFEDLLWLLLSNLFK